MLNVLILENIKDLVDVVVNSDIYRELFEFENGMVFSYDILELQEPYR